MHKFLHYTLYNCILSSQTTAAINIARLPMTERILHVNVHEFLQEKIIQV